MIWKYFLEVIMVSFTKLYSFTVNFSSSLSKKKHKFSFLKTKYWRTSAIYVQKWQWTKFAHILVHVLVEAHFIPVLDVTWVTVHALFLASATSSVICKYLHISCFFISSQPQCCAYATQRRTAPYLYLAYFGLFRRILHYIVK